MAELHNPPGTLTAMESLVVDRSDGTRCFDAAEGTREQLVAAGLCTPACFPPGRKRSAWGDGWNLEALGRGRWRLHLDLTDEQRRERMRQKTQRARARLVAERIAAGPERWRAEAAHHVDATTTAMIRQLSGDAEWSRRGYKLGASDLATLEALADRMNAVLANARIERDDSQAEAAHAAAGDARLQAFLGSLTGTPRPPARP